MIKYDENYYEEYFRNNYNDCLLPGYGVETCLAWIRESFQAGSWCDIGSGSSGLFWATMAHSDISDITLSDFSSLPFKYVKTLLNSKFLPYAYTQAMQLHNISYTDVLRTFSLNITLEILDVFKKWEIKRVYNNISAMGLLGLSGDTQRLKYLISEVYMHLENDGVFFGASWLFSDKYSREINISSEPLLSLGEHLLSAGFSDIEISVVDYDRDSNYTGILLFRCYRRD